MALVFIQHQLPRRLRLNVPSRRGDPLFFNDLVRPVSAAPGVAGLNAHPVTGSLIIRPVGDIEAVGSLWSATELVRSSNPRRLRARGTAAGWTRTRNWLSAYRASVCFRARGELTGSAWRVSGTLCTRTHLRRPVRGSSRLTRGVPAGKGEVLNSATALMFYALTAQRLSREDNRSRQVKKRLRALELTGPSGRGGRGPRRDMSRTARCAERRQRQMAICMYQRCNSVSRRLGHRRLATQSRCELDPEFGPLAKV